ncbi:MAG: class I SAM-dependent methyltransferase [Candidatus Woesearchaeota archaeon]
MHQHSNRGTGKIVNTHKVISLLVKPNDFFADIGCGPGDYLKEAAKLTKNAIGIDIDTVSIEKVKALHLKGIVADATKKIPLKSSSLDSILLANVLHGFVANNEMSAMKEIARLLKRKGLLGIVEFRKNMTFGIGPDRKIRLSKKEVIDLIEPYGFSKIGSAWVGLFNYLVIFEKI